MSVSPPAAALLAAAVPSVYRRAAIALVARRRRLPAPGALGVGDRLFPELGNPGYDVLRLRHLLRLPAATPSRCGAVPPSTPAPPHAAGRALQPRLRPRQGAVRPGQRPPARYRRARARTWSSPPPARSRRGAGCGSRSVTPATPRRRDGGWIRTRTGWPWPTRRTPPTASSPATTTPPTRPASPSASPPQARSRSSRAGCPRARRARAATTTWTYRTRAPHGHRAGAGLHRPLRRACTEGPHGLPLRDVVPSSRPARALEPWLARTAGADGVDGAAGRAATRSRTTGS